MLNLVLAQMLLLCATSSSTSTQARPFEPMTAVPSVNVQSLLGSRDWTAKSEDSICGLRDLAQVSNPAVIDFQACLDATPEMKKVKADKIDLKSPEGIRLLADATTRVTEACESVARANGYCSVWKSIKHKDGRSITDVSSQVTALF